MILIGVSGFKGSGKNTFAKKCLNDLACNYGRVAHEMSWASLLKESAAASLGIELTGGTETAANEWADEFKSVGQVTVSYRDKAGSDYPDVTISGREFLQNYGTEAHREIFDDDFWVNAFWTNNDFREDDIVFICDTRFENEARSIKEHNGLIIQIANDKVDSAANDTHASEVPLPGEYIDIVVDNNGTIDDLTETAETFVASIMDGEKLKKGI